MNSSMRDESAEYETASVAAAKKHHRIGEKNQTTTITNALTVCAVDHEGASDE